MEKLGHLHIVGRNSNLFSSYGKQFDGSKKLYIELLCVLAIPLLGLYPRELKTYSNENMHTDVHSSINLKLPKGRKQYPTYLQYINEIWYIHTIEY